MKLSPQSFSTIVAGITCLVAPGFAATEAMTDPVGFITVSVGGGSAPSPQYSLVAPTLVQPVSWQGVCTTITGNTISVAGSPWTVDQFNDGFYVEVISGANAGAWTDISDTTADSITTASSLASFAGNGASIRIRKHVTISNFLGAANSAGLQGGETAEGADEVLIYDGSNPTIYFYCTLGGFVGWRDLEYNDKSNQVIEPDQGVVVKRKTNGTVSFVSSGTVKTGNTYLPVAPGFNVLGTIASQGLTLATSGLYTGNPNTGLQASNTSAENADELIVYNPTPQIYWYSTIPGLEGWRDLEYSDVGNVVIAAGTSVVVNRKGGHPQFNWVVPIPTSF